MTRAIDFPATESRCRPFFKPCPQQDHCARYLAVPKAGQAVADYSHLGTVYITALICPQYMSVQKAAELAKLKPVKAWIGGSKL